MKIGNAIIGSNQGVQLSNERAQREEALAAQKEQLARNNSRQDTQDSNNQKLFDRKLSLLDEKLAKVDRENFVRSSDDAMAALTDGDTSLMMNMLKTDNGKELFNNVVKFDKASDLDVYDGNEDNILLDSGFTAEQISKLTLEEKQKYIKDFGDDVYLMTSSDGSVVTTNLENLASISGYTGRQSKAKQQRMYDAVKAGGLKRGLSQALVDGDEELAQKFKEAIALTTKKTSATTKTKEQKNAETIVQARAASEGKVLSNEELALKAGEYMDQDSRTAMSKNLDVKADLLAQSKDLGADLLAANTDAEASTILGTKSANKIRMVEAKNMRSDPLYKDSIKGFQGTIAAVGQFYNVMDQILSKDIKADMFTKGIDRLTSMTNMSDKDKKDEEFWSTNPNDKATYVSQIDHATRGMADKTLRLATVALIKSMSGLAVSDGEREMYFKLVGLNDTAASREVLLAAKAFIASNRLSMSTFLTDLSQEYPTHGAIYKRQLNRATKKYDARVGKDKQQTAPKQNTEDIVANRKAEADANKLVVQELVKGLTRGFD